MIKISNLLLVFAGGGIGATFRYLLSLLYKTPINGFPLSTFGINVIGCFLIGLIYQASSIESFHLKIFLMVGVLGGFTTFSTFGLETYNLLASSKYQTAFFYVILSNICGLAAVYAGIKISSLTL